ncbi:acetate--CoA ligase family protein [Azospirillum halopraeferens]|uniref:acetate--CoA ligase family protein n=1 Tax=Azospirillum halopraeferens TaxID=34010 RepID=UPI0003F5C870|nr:acetate--CoA ligase family protein [Azospirillum halopraeferens]
MDGRRPLASAECLRRLFAPTSIAIVGASARPGSFGARTAENLAHFTGHLHLVNPRYDHIGDRPCHRSLADLPEAPDVVVLATGKETTETLLDEAIAVGAGGVVVYASGFAETGDPRTTAMQARIAGRAREAGIPLIGPNAIGFVAFERRAGVTFLTGLDLERGYARPAGDRRIGLVSQSGALGLSLAQAMQRDLYLSHVLTCGNSCDVDVADCVSFLAEDPSCRVIACVLEGLADPRRLEEAVRKATAAGKPALVCKMAKGEEGARAAVSHTGSLAGSHAAYRTMVERAGGLFVDGYDALLPLASFLAKAPPPTAPGVAVIATSGGAAIMAADAAEAAGVPLPQPSPEVAAVLGSHIPDFGSARNPCDVTAEVVNDLPSLTACVTAVLAQPDIGAVVVPYPLAYETAFPRIALLDRLAAEAGKIICKVWLSGWLEGPGAREIEAAPHLALFHSMDRCFAALAARSRWHGRAAPPADRPRRAPADAAPAVAAALESAGSGAVAERTAKALLARYGVPVVEERRAATAPEARRVATELGFPVVMKIDSADLPHKTEVGGVALGLADADAVEAACTAMVSRIAASHPEARLDGVLLQRMVPKGVEIVVGARMDPAFGPLVVVGLGGVLVELLRDSVAAPAPVTPGEAEAMLRGLKGARILDGFRDLPAVDVPALSELVARVSEFAADQAGRFTELDVNPLICRGDDIVAVDALIVRD